MIDPASIGLAISAANTAFSAIKKGFAVGRDIEQMSGDIGRWMAAVSDVDNAQKSAANASPLIKLFKGKEIQASAIEAFTAKKKLEQQRAELKQFLIFTYGMSAWNELLAMEGKIRKERQEMIYARKEFIQKIINGVAIGILTLTIIGFIGLLSYLYKEKHS